MPNPQTFMIPIYSTSVLYDIDFFTVFNVEITTMMVTLVTLALTALTTSHNCLNRTHTI